MAKILYIIYFHVVNSIFFFIALGEIQSNLYCAQITRNSKTFQCRIRSSWYVIQRLRIKYMQEVKVIAKLETLYMISNELAV